MSQNMQAGDSEKDTYRFDRLRAKEKAIAPTRVRWYKGYSGRGRADVLVSQLSHYLNKHKLTDTVCGLRIERRPRREYYFFLTLETDYPGQLPPEIEDTLQECPLLNVAAGGPYQLSEIQGMVSGELKIKALGQCLSYRQMRQEISDDPFGLETTGQNNFNHGLTQQAEQLLLYLSSSGTGSWSGFRRAAIALGIGEQARTLARRLQLLGHLEFSQDGQTWAVSPPWVISVKTQNGDILRFLCGARRNNFVAEREEQGGAPARLCITETPEDWPELQEAAHQLAAALPTLTEYAASLETLGGVNALGQTFAILEGNTFKKVSSPAQAGLYEITSASGRKITALLSPDGSWRRSEWYGLRFLQLHAADLLLPAQYDASTWRLALPTDQQPPELYERALVLCSGLLPIQRGEWLVYSNVAPAVAEQVTSKLALSLQHSELPNEEST